MLSISRDGPNGIFSHQGMTPDRELSAKDGPHYKSTNVPMCFHINRLGFFVNGPEGPPKRITQRALRPSFLCRPPPCCP